MFKKNFDKVNLPHRYAGTKIEVIDQIEDKNLGFCLGNVIKYISRVGSKLDCDGQDQIEKEIEDLKKTVCYINRRIHDLEDGLFD